MKIIYGLLILSLIVCIHEAGHFLMAILSGVKVETFSIGMGPVLFHKTIRGVDFRISLLPVGGYCGMKGEQDYQKAYEENLPFIPGDSDSFYGTSPLKRSLIAFAGPFANLLLTVLCFTIISSISYAYYTASNKVNLVTDTYPEMYSAAKEAGIQSGDTILMMNNQEITDFSDILSYISVHGDEFITVKVLRDNQELEFIVKTIIDKETGAGKIGLMSDGSTVIQKYSKAYKFPFNVIQGFKETGGIFRATLKGISSLFKGVKITKAVSGPARITTMLGETVQYGFSAGFISGLISVLNFVAVISISLFLMNLLPIPVLDGGLILFSLIEFIFNTHISPKVRFRVQYIGIAFIAVLFVIAMIGDFSYFLGLLNEH